MVDPEPVPTTPKTVPVQDVVESAAPASTQRRPIQTSSPDAPKTPETRYGRFALQHFHARGGLGEVHVAIDEELRREVALKRLQERWANDPAARRRFLNEAEITAKLEHPGVVPIHGLVQDENGQPCYAMRFIEGESLAEAIRKWHAADTNYAALPFRQMLQRFVSVCQTIAFAHSKHIIHRDIKPVNIMLGPFGETLVVDWGLAREVVSGQQPVVGDESVLSSTMNFTPSGSDERVYTQAGQALGTLGYMAPEQAAGRWNVVGPHSDVDSLGATLYEMLTGMRPIRGSDQLEALQRAQAGDFPAPRKVKDAVPKALEAICLKAMALKPEDRYATAKDLAADVEHWLADEAVGAYAEPWSVRAGRWLRRHRTLTVGAGILTAAAVVVLGVVAVLLDQARVRVEAEQAVTAQERNKALENLALARTNFGIARDALDKTVTRIAEHERLKEADFSDTRKELLALAVPAYEELVQQRSDDPDLKADRGRAYHRLAFVRTEIGESAGAIDNYERMRKIFAKLAADFPSRPEFRQELAASYNNLGGLLRSTGRLAEAETALRDALALRKKLAADFTTRPDFRQELATSHHNLGLVLRDTGRLADAETADRDAVAILKQLTGDFPTRSEFRQALAKSHNNLGNLLRDTGRLADAEAAHRDALVLQDQLAADFPTRPEFRQELARCHTYLGNLLRDTGRPADAETAHRAALDLYKQLAADFPTRPEFRQELAMSHYNLGLLLRATGRLADAETAYRDALALQKQLAADFPTRPDFRQDMAASHNNLGILFSATGRLASAETAYRDALALRKQLAADFPTHPDFRNELAASHNNIGLLLHATGRLADAETAYRDALALRKKLAADFPTRPDYRWDLAASHNNLGLLLHATGRLADAETAYRDALALQMQLTADFPNQPDLRNALAATFVNLALLGHQRGDFRAAKAYLEEAQPHHQAALKANPRHPTYRQFYRNNLITLVSAHAGLLDQASAVQAAERLRDLGWDPPGNAYDAACALARCVPIVEKAEKLDSAKRQAAIDFYCDQAMTMLRAAVAKGYKDIEHLKKDDDLKALRERADYQKLVKELEEKKQP
jgi:serine/threonine-protein kinase